jgi:hypothetical protein
MAERLRLIHGGVSIGLNDAIHMPPLRQSLYA